MALRYMPILSSDMLIVDMEEHIKWFGDIVRAVIFSQNADISIYELPNSLLAWCEKEADNIGLRNDLLEKLKYYHLELEIEVKKIIENLNNGVELTPDSYNLIEQNLFSYIKELKKLQENTSGINVAIDPLTGLRSMSGMKNDIQKELDRRERKGSAFCVCEVEIDKVLDLIKIYDKNTMNVIYKKLAKLVLNVIRSFDDAYYLGEGRYLIMLKHIDILDACSVMDRMREEIAGLTIDVEGSFEPLHITASFGVVEPVPGDKIDEILLNLKNAVVEAKDLGGNQVVQWKERSSLQKYAIDSTCFD